MQSGSPYGRGQQVHERAEAIEANLSGERVTGGDVRRASAVRSKASRERAALRDLKNRTIAVIPDLMLDRYLHVDVDRISPEAPVPVVHRRSEMQFPAVTPKPLCI